MKLTMNFKEIAAMAGIVKEVRETIDPSREKETIQQMMSKVVENFKDEEKHSFVTIKLDSSMNLVINAEGEAVIRILDLFKKYFVAAYPMIKLLGETGMKMGSEIQEVIDDYKDPEEDKSVNLTIVNIAQTEHDSKSDISEQKTTKSSKKKKHICPICLRSAMIDPKKGNITCKICGQDMLRVE